MNQAAYDKTLASPQGATISCRVNIRKFDQLRLRPLTIVVTPKDDEVDYVHAGSFVWLNIEGVVGGQAVAIGRSLVVYHPSQFCYCPPPGRGDCPCRDMPASFRALRWHLFWAWYRRRGDPKDGHLGGFWRMLREMGGNATS